LDFSCCENAQIDRVLVAKKRHSNIVDVLFIRGAECDGNHYQVIAQLGDSVSKEATKMLIWKNLTPKG
jgi:hypothetical protein